MKRLRRRIQIAWQFSGIQRFLKRLWRRETGVWIVRDFSGYRAIREKIHPPPPDPTRPPAPTFFLWFVGVYIALFGLTTQQYENALDRLENRTNAIIAQIGTDARKSAIELIPQTQNTKLPRKPRLFLPWSPVCSLLCPGEPDTETVQLLKKVIESNSTDLYDVNLHRADLREADLYDAGLHRADLREADLREADLREADLRWANLRWADLSTAKNLKQKQINQACLDDTTKLPSGLDKPKSIPEECKALWPEDFR